MENVEQIYRYRESLLDRQCPKHLKTRELRNAWHESIKKEYELLTQKIERLESEVQAMSNLEKFAEAIATILFMITIFGVAWLVLVVWG